MSDSFRPCGLQHSRHSSISWTLLKFMSIELVVSSNHLILSHPLLLWLSIFPSIRVLSNELAFHIRWPKYWNFSFRISPSKEYSELISFRIDWLDPLAVQGTLKSLLQHHNFKSINSSSQPTATAKETHTSLWSNSHIHTWLQDKPQL